MKFFLALIFCCCLLCLSTQQKFAPIDLNKLDFKIIGPLYLVDLLKNKDNRRNNVRLSFMNYAPDNWVTEKDLPCLMAFIDNHDTCKCLVSPLSSTYYPNDYAMINGQVADMINSFRDKNLQFPPGFYACSKTDYQKIVEIKKWWRTFNKK